MFYALVQVEEEEEVELEDLDIITMVRLGGGGASLQQTSYISVTPGTTYTITIGNGGNGGAPNADGSRGFDGNSTSLDNLFIAIGGGKGYVQYGGNNFPNGYENLGINLPGTGGIGGYLTAATDGQINYLE